MLSAKEIATLDMECVYCKGLHNSQYSFKGRHQGYERINHPGI